MLTNEAVLALFRAQSDSRVRRVRGFGLGSGALGIKTQIVVEVVILEGKCLKIDDLGMALHSGKKCAC
jgi:hypothetical protein